MIAYRSPMSTRQTTKTCEQQTDWLWHCVYEQQTHNAKLLRRTIHATVTGLFVPQTSFRHWTIRTSYFCRMWRVDSGQKRSAGNHQKCYL